jgi:hypothetical protein
MSLLQCACLNHLHPYPKEEDVCRRSGVADPGNDDFWDLYLANFIEANKCVAHRHLECLALPEH